MNTPVGEPNSTTSLMLSFSMPALGVHTELPFVVKLNDFRSGAVAILTEMVEALSDGLLERGLLCPLSKGEDGLQSHRQLMDRFADDVSKASQCATQSSFYSLANAKDEAPVPPARPDPRAGKKAKCMLLQDAGQCGRQKFEFK